MRMLKLVLSVSMVGMMMGDRCLPFIGGGNHIIDSLFIVAASSVPPTLEAVPFKVEEHGKKVPCSHRDKERKGESPKRSLVAANDHNHHGSDAER